MEIFMYQILSTHGEGLICLFVSNEFYPCGKKKKLHICLNKTVSNHSGRGYQQPIAIPPY